MTDDDTVTDDDTAEELDRLGVAPEVWRAYVSIVGAEYAEPDACADAYVGAYDTPEDFARETADDTGALPAYVAWPLTCIDWEYAARELMMDYGESGGYYFRNL